MTSTIFGPPVTSAPVARTAAAPAFSDRDAAPAPPAPAATSATRATVASCPATMTFSSGIGVTAVAAVRRVVRARWTSWRTAPSVSPSSAAMSEWARPSTATASSAARWREGSEATPSSVRRISSRRSSSVSGPVKSPTDSGISSSASPARLRTLIAPLWAMRYSHGLRSRTSVPARSEDHALRNVAWSTSSASDSDSRRRR